MTTSQQYDNLKRLTNLSSTHAGPSSTSFAYQYNDANQRTKTTLADNSCWLYQYDGLGQLTSGKRSWSDNVPVAGQQFEYVINDIGNRTLTKQGGDASGTGLRARTYSPNTVTPGWRTVLNTVDILGLADAGPSVTVNGQTAYRKGTYYQSVVTVDNSGGDAYATVTVNGGGMSSGGKVFVPRSVNGWEFIVYDVDGNQQSDGRWNYTWDTENRLTKALSWSDAPLASKRQVEMEYDWQGRRIKRTVWTTADGTTWTVQTVRKYVYDGWNVIAEVDGNNNLVQSYLWGLDLSGTMQGAGRVGGLLAVKPGNGIARFVAMDGNGNVAGLVTGSAGPSVNGAYEYGPFGEPIRVTGTMGKANPFRWSTKYTDDETDLVYYGYRYYSPSTGRWLSRDPIGERGGPNLYAFVRNNPISLADPLGLDQWHHLLPPGVFKPWVLQLMGLDPNVINNKEFGRILNDDAHRMLHPEWNIEWQDWLDDQLTRRRPITVTTVIGKLERMKDDERFIPYLAFGYDADVDYETWSSMPSWRKRCRAVIGKRAPSPSKPPLSAIGSKLPSYLLLFAAANMMTSGNATAQAFSNSYAEFVGLQRRGDTADADLLAAETARLAGELWGGVWQLRVWESLHDAVNGRPLSVPRTLRP